MQDNIYTHVIQGPGPSKKGFLFFKNYSRGQIFIPWLGDTADFGIGLLYRPAKLEIWRVGTTTSCQSLLQYSPSQGLRIWLLDIPQTAIEIAYYVSHHTLQRKGRWESNINVWFPFMYSQKWNCYLQNRIIMFCLPVPSLIYVWEIIFPGSVCLFCCRKICGPILGIYKSLTDTWMWKLGLRPHNSQKRKT